MTWHILPPLLCGSLALSLALLLLFRRPLTPVRRSLMVLCFITAHWQACWFATYFVVAPSQKIWLMRIAWTLILFIPVAFYEFAVWFLDIRSEHRYVPRAWWLTAAFLPPLWTTRLFLSGTKDFWWGYYPLAGPLHVVYVIGAMAIMIRSVYLLWAQARLAGLSSAQRKRRQYAFLIFFVYLLTSPEYLINYGVPLYPVGPVTLSAGFLLAFYAISRYQLLDVKLVISRTGLFLTVYLVVLGLPLLVGWRGQAWLQAQMGAQWWLVPVGLCMALATIGPFAYGYLRRQTEQHLMQELTRTQARANMDALTGTLTRRAFEEQASFELLAVQELRQPLSLLMIDLDHFKEKNDTYGHLVGDGILQEVATRLTRTLRQGDLLGRFGGEEFVILLPRADQVQALAIAERLREAVATHPILTEAGPLPQTLSIGLSVAPTDGHALETLIAKADQALYAAKHAGRNRVAQGGVPS